MRAWSHDRFRFPLPAGHRFPLSKYPLLRERVIADGLLAPGDFVEAEPIAWGDLALVHDAAYLRRVRCGDLDEREQRVIGLPWSPQLVARARRSAGGTVAAARDAVGAATEGGPGLGLNLGGGTHHAGVAAARGYCLFNDVAAAIVRLRADGSAERALVVDCDVHQGDGTAEIFAADPQTFTLSVHCARNYPFSRERRSDLDVEVPAGTGDDRYLALLKAALDDALERHGDPDLVVYLAGADPWKGDRLGRLALSKAGLRARDALVLDRVLATGAATCVVLAGGYAPDLADTVDVNTATVAEVVARAAPRSQIVTPSCAPVVGVRALARQENHGRRPSSARSQRMADSILFIPWGPPISGREQRGLEVFGEAVAYYGELQAEGRIERFDVALLQPNGFADGFVILHGTAEQVDALRRDDRFRRLTVEASLIVKDVRLIDGSIGDGLGEAIDMYSEAIAGVPQTVG